MRNTCAFKIYFILRMNETFKLGGQFLNDEFSFIKFGIEKCKNKTVVDIHDSWKYTCLSAE